MQHKIWRSFWNGIMLANNQTAQEMSHKAHGISYMYINTRIFVIRECSTPQQGGSILRNSVQAEVDWSLSRICNLYVVITHPVFIDILLAPASYYAPSGPKPLFHYQHLIPLADAYHWEMWEIQSLLVKLPLLGCSITSDRSPWQCHVSSTTLEGILMI